MKLLVVSSYGRRCGIAQYVERLVPVLKAIPGLEVVVAPLPTILLASGPVAQREAKEIMDNIVAQAADADVVNLQYEPGLYASDPMDAWRRIKMILGASKKAIITYHTVAPQTSIPFFRVRSRFRAFYAYLSFHRILRLSRKSPGRFGHVVQTKREALRLKLQGIDPSLIRDTPLMFLTQEQKASFDKKSSRRRIDEKYGTNGRKVVGVFGFISQYKGTLTAIDALRHLPPNYHLLIVGALHPQELKSYTQDQPYISNIVSKLEMDRQSINGENKVNIEPLVERIHFCGDLDDDEFADVMSGCDAVILPYSEVGQTSSGPAGIALDLQKPVYCSRTHCFAELARYAEGAISFFDVGNHIELAQLIHRNDIAGDKKMEARAAYGRSYSIEKRADTYAALARTLSSGA